jgi:hypothetical protein
MRESLDKKSHHLPIDRLVVHLLKKREKPLENPLSMILDIDSRTEWKEFAREMQRLTGEHGLKYEFTLTFEDTIRRWALTAGEEDAAPHTKTTLPFDKSLFNDDLTLARRDKSGRVFHNHPTIKPKVYNRQWIAQEARKVGLDGITKQFSTLTQMDENWAKQYINSLA